MTAKQVAIRLKTDGKAEVKRDLAEVGAAGSQAQDRLASSTDKATQAADRQMAKWKQMAAAARQAQEAQERQAAFNSALGVGGGSGKSAADSAAAFMAGGKGRGLTAMQRQTLVYTASDVFASAASGMNPGMIAMQQGPQVLQAWAVGGNAASASMWKLAAGVGAVAAVVGTATAAWLHHQSVLRQIEAVTRGLGATSGMTVGQVEEMSVALARSSELSQAAIRSMAATYLSTGRIGEQVLQKLIGVTQRYAVATGQDAETATRELASAFSGPAAGADLLNSKLQILDDKTAQYIRTLLSQNRVTEAQLELSKALDTRLQTNAEYVDVLGNAFRRLKKDALDAFDAGGRAIDRFYGGGTAEDRLKGLQFEKKHGFRVGTDQPNFSALIFGRPKSEIDADIEKLKKQIAGAASKATELRNNQASQDARDAIDRANPSAASLRQKQSDLKLIQDAVDSGVIKRADAANAIKSLNADIHALANGYKTATGEASALARQQRQATAAARKAAQEALRDAKEDNRLAELKADNALTVIKLKMGQRGDYDRTTLRAQAEELERQIRLRQMVAQFVSAGVERTQALAMAERQLGEESRATWAGMVSDVSKAIDGFISTAEAMKKVGEQVGRINRDQDAINSMADVGSMAFDRLADRLANSGRAFESWRSTISNVIQDISAEFVKLAVLNPIKNAIFGGITGYKALPSITSIGGFVKGLVGRNAAGTDNWRGGLTWVGEQGPELVNLPRGAQVLSNARSNAVAGGQLIVNVTVHADGAVLTDTVKGWVADGVRQAIQESGANVPGIVNDAKTRRLIK